MAAREHFVPYPELLEVEPHEVPYRFEDSAGSAPGVSGAVDMIARWMRVPFEAEGRYVRRHEYGHVRWSPPRPARVGYDPRILAAVEDARINLGLAHVELPVELDAEGEALVQWLLAQDAKRGDVFALCIRGVASIGTSVEAPVAQVLARTPPFGPLVVEQMQRVRGAFEALRTRVRGPVAPYAGALREGRLLARWLRMQGLLDASEQARSKLVFGCAVEAPHVHGDTPPRPRSPERDAPPPAGVLPGSLRIARPPLCVGLKSGRGPLRWRAAREGSVVRHVQRWPLDGAIFRARRHHPGGTLLVDTSGSMSLDVDALDRLLAATPVGTRVAIYSGRGEEGELRIVAQGGRRAARDQLGRFGSGNIVDLPALAWLAGQPRPRIWLSDGGVTGVGDRSCGLLQRRCEELRRRGGIRRVADLATAARLLGGVVPLVG
jgi:hypothetical protein